MDRKRTLGEDVMGIRNTNLIGRLATLGLITILLALASFAAWTAVTSLNLSSGVVEAVAVSDLYGQARVNLLTEESLEHAYGFHPGPGVRSQFQLAAALLAKHL